MVDRILFIMAVVNVGKPFGFQLEIHILVRFFEESGEFYHLHRFLWEQKVAKKVKVCKLFSQLSSCTLFMGAKSCEKSLETFTFDNNRAIWSKSLQTFCVANVAEESCTAEKIPVRGSAKS